MRKHVMVDIETYATSNDLDGRSPMISQIGACWADLGGVVMDDTFLVSVADVENPVYYRDPRTVEWWSNQSQAAQESLYLNLVPTIRDALESFQHWLNIIGFTKDAEKCVIWANPPSFDLVHIASACKRESLPLPWHYRQERCCRTIYHEVPNRRGCVPAGTGNLVKHRADHDAIRQLAGILPMLHN